ncbi:hypothetical protein [Hyalangium minutum]|uniref:Uncharacterized protein n=1 Tax=Hyalangium minutum TaxID=394096 RepID=A0A085WIC5_9BACT|nr:hypothetical protein [Hyalangium minutum]KFE67351.1 hypothetical protein DB31_8704 [Hyalangium minutum]KFE67438.1 hypothetical protein DB31_8791 [Hyalangium minutum]
MSSNWQKNRVGPYTVLRRLRNATGGEGGVGRLYTAWQSATGRPALLVTAAAPGHYAPAEEYRLRVRAGTSPSPYVALEVERAPQGTNPLGQVNDGLDALACVLEGLEHHPEAMAHLCAPAARPRARMRSWQWAALAGLLACSALAPRAWKAAQPIPEETEQPALASVAEEALAEPEALPVGAVDAQRPAVGLDLPPRPFKGQRKAPCEDGTEFEIELKDGTRACWVQIVYSRAACKTRGYEWQGRCYLPSIPTPKEPSSTLPVPPVPAQRAH